ncbi:MAG: DUF4861 family protein [Bacteroidales bacterium]|nr:DUF4861 family protein [Bacteroidales bacterium]
MNNNKLVAAFIIVLLGVFPGIEAQYYVKLSNSLPIQRFDEPVVLLRDSIEKKTGLFGNKLTFLIKTANGETVPSQTDDIDGDGRWDELAVLLDFNAGETVQLILEPITHELLPPFRQRAHVHLGVSCERNNVFTRVLEETRPKNHVAQSLPFLYQYEGPGWENDKLAFRTYFDSRNGKDVFGKLVPDMIIDSIGLPGKSYHEMSYWGMDVLKVGKSLGVGAIAVTDGDSIYRLGETGAALYKAIADGPVRAVFTLNYQNWNIHGDILSFSEQITIWGGKYHFSSKAALAGNEAHKYSLVTGITTLHLIDEGYISEFDSSANGHKIIAINNVLSENNDFLALGLMANTADYKSWFRAPETGIGDAIIKTACMVFNSGQKPFVEFHVFAGWEKTDIRFKTDRLLNTIMQNEALRLSNKIVIIY